MSPNNILKLLQVKKRRQETEKDALTKAPDTYRYIFSGVVSSIKITKEIKCQFVPKYKIFN